MLFEKPVSELREVFVQNRFSEEKYFGRPDIEEWLEVQRKAKVPDEGQWNHCTSSSDRMLFYARDNPIEFLRDYAEPSSGIPQGLLEKEGLEEQVEHRAKLRPILESFVSDKVDIYYPYVHSPIVVWKGECEAAPEAFYFKLSHDANGHLTTTIVYGVPSPMVMDAIFAAWWRGTSKAGRARRLLCDLLAHDIATVRMEAEVDFENAVAVSAEGKKIISAKYVAVMPDRGERGTVLFYRDASVFRENKILRHSSTHLDRQGISVTIEREIRVVMRWLADWRLGWHGGSFETLFFGNHGESILIAPRHLCPDPLPEGGEEVFTLL